MGIRLFSMADCVFPVAKMSGGAEATCSLDYRYDEKSTVARQLWVLPCWLHQGTSDCSERARSCLLVRSVPGYATASSVRRVFARFRPVQEVILQWDNTSVQSLATSVPAVRHKRVKGEDKNTALGDRQLVADRDETRREDHFVTLGAADLQPPRAASWFKVAYLVYSDAETASAAWRKVSASAARTASVYLSPSAHPLPPDASGPPLWRVRQRHSIVHKPAVVKAAIDQFMEEFERQEAKDKRRQARAKNLPDDEGWITVGKRSGVSKPELPKLASIEKDAAHKRKRKGKRKAAPIFATDFYRFQVREGALRQAEELRHKFKQDKKRIALMKAARVFKP